MELELFLFTIIVRVGDVAKLDAFDQLNAALFSSKGCCILIKNIGLYLIPLELIVAGILFSTSATNQLVLFVADDFEMREDWTVIDLRPPKFGINGSATEMIIS